VADPILVLFLDTLVLALFHEQVVALDKGCIILKLALVPAVLELHVKFPFEGVYHLEKVYYYEEIACSPVLFLNFLKVFLGNFDLHAFNLL